MIKHKLSLFKSFAPDRVATVIEEEYFHLRFATINKHIQMSTDRIVMQPVFDQCIQPVVGFSHVGGFCIKHTLRL